MILFGTDYVERALDCIEELKTSVKNCEGAKSIGLSSCVYENSEIAFREKQIDIEKVSELKTKAHELRGNFYENCECKEKPHITLAEMQKIVSGNR